MNTDSADMVALSAESAGISVLLTKSQCSKCLTFPLFDQHSIVHIVEGMVRQSLLAHDDQAQESHYRCILIELGKGAGLAPAIFRKAWNTVQDPAKLPALARWRRSAHNPGHWAVY